MTEQVVRPVLDLDSHRRAAQTEDAAFLLANGAHPDDVAARTGLGADAAYQRAHRAERRTRP